MIKSLLIKNFILIDELFLEFENGFNVLIGETGAGKSIIIKAIDAALGARVQKDVIKNNLKSALIEITFDSIKGLDDFENEVIISREISANSQKYRVNGALVNADYIKELRYKLLDIHTQHESYNYVQAKTHIGLLDNYCANDDLEYKFALLNYKENYQNYVDVSKKLEKIKETNTNNDREIDFLKFQINEIDSAEILPNEEEDINLEIEKLSNVQNLKETTYGAHWALSQGDSILEALSKIRYSISNAKELDGALADADTAFNEAYENLKFCSDFLRDYSENLSDNPERLSVLNERLSLILKLKRKYGDIFKTREELQKQLDELLGNNSSIEELEILKDKYFCAIDENSKILSQKREEYAPKLAKKIEVELSKLELEKARFEIQLKKCDFSPNGRETAEFLISTNVSSLPSSLSKVASGGEISRVVLAIKTIFAKSENVSTIIFDEIDTGISGKATNAVANAIFALSKDIQVFAITHQPVIASRASAYFMVKKVQEDETKITVEKITDELKKAEALAQLAVGKTNDIALDFAKDLLNSTEQLKMDFN